MFRLLPGIFDIVPLRVPMGCGVLASGIAR